MTTATCVFDILNDSPDELFLYLEPEGNEFRLPPGKKVQVCLFGSTHPIKMMHSSDARGRRTVSFWPENGDFELFFEEKSVWEQL